MLLIGLDGIDTLGGGLANDTLDGGGTSIGPDRRIGGDGLDQLDGEANTGRTPTAEARQRMSEAQKRRGVRLPAAGVAWTSDEDAMLTLTPAEVVAKTDRTLSAVYSRRSDLGFED